VSAFYIRPNWVAIYCCCSFVEKQGRRHSEHSGAHHLPQHQSRASERRPEKETEHSPRAAERSSRPLFRRTNDVNSNLYLIFSRASLVTKILGGFQGSGRGGRDAVHAALKRPGVAGPHHRLHHPPAERLDFHPLPARLLLSRRQMRLPGGHSGARRFFVQRALALSAIQ
jgi:hypothetical protein